MKKLLLLAVPFLIIGCGSTGGKVVSAAIDDQPRPPTYCVRGVVDNGDGTVMLDMPGYPYGMNDRPIKVEQWRVDMLLESDWCTPDDPRMQ